MTATATDLWNTDELDSLVEAEKAYQANRLAERTAQYSTSRWAPSFAAAVAGVRNQGAARMPSGPVRTARPAPLVATAAPRLSEKQAAFATSLCTERGLAADATDLLMAAASTGTVSALIDALLAMPKATAPAAPAAASPALNAGRYATTNEDGTTGFWRVWVGRTGYTKVYLIVGGEQGEGWGQEATRAQAAAALRKIAVDPAAAMRRYGQEIGRCGHCNRLLTDEASRAAGIGPRCAGKA